MTLNLTTVEELPDTKMSSNNTERRIYLGIFITAMSLIVILGTLCCIVFVMNRRTLQERNREPRHVESHPKWWLYNRHQVDNIEKGITKISPLTAFRTLRLVEKQLVESSDKDTVAQSHRNAVEYSSGPRKFAVVNERSFKRPEGNWI